jgi:Effector Associated Constant Component 1
MENRELELTLGDVSPAEAHELAKELGSFLRSEDKSLEVRLARDDPTRQDFGATLVLLVGSAAGTAIAKGIRAWMAKRGGAKLVAKNAKGESLVLTNASSMDIAAVSKAVEKLLDTDTETEPRA